MKVKSYDTQVEELNELLPQVEAWARDNFGGNESKADAGLVLGSLAPLLGVIEEMGEGVVAQTDEDAIDALADIGIFMLDYCGREGLQVELPERDAEDLGMLSAIGNLCHATLKRHQGIRGFDDPGKFRAHQRDAVASLWLTLIVRLDRELKVSYSDVVRKTWDKIVSKRNWNA